MFYPQGRDDGFLLAHLAAAKTCRTFRNDLGQSRRIEGTLLERLGCRLRTGMAVIT